MPKVFSPRRDSPESLSRIRWYARGFLVPGILRASGVWPGPKRARRGPILLCRRLGGCDVLAEPETGEAAHHDVLLDDGDLLLDELAHGELGLLDEGLLEQAEGGVVLLELALGDPVDHRRRLALGEGLGFVDLFLLLEGLGRHLLLGHVEGD